MRWLSAGVALLLAGVCLAADTPPAAAPALCSNSPGAPACHGPAKDLKAARQAFARGLKLEKSQDMDRAFYEFEEASRLVPQNVEYVTAREITRQDLAGMHLDRGNRALLDGRQVEALAEFRTALTLDPQNEFAQQRISDALGPVPVHTAAPPQVIASADALVAKPIDGHHDIHYRGDSRGLLTAVAASYGLTVVFDDNFPSRHVRFDIENADFATAMQAASAIAKSFTVALEDTVLFACGDTPENHRSYDRMGMRSFYIPADDPTKDLNELMNALRTIFELKFASSNAASSTIALRGPQAALEAATQFLGQLYSPRPEVLLDLKVFQVSHTYAHNIGLHVPDNFNLYNISAGALAALGGQSLQSLLNNANSQTIAALLAQLQNQQNSIFSQPLATFGGGLTFMGLSLDQLSAVLSMNESSVQELDHVQLRASQTKEATFKLGSRYPIVNSSYSAGLSSAALKALGVQSSSVAMIPSVSYEDIGLTLKAKPLVHSNSDVALELEIQFRTLGAAAANGNPIISNREYKGGILLKEGEPAAVAGMITESDQKSLNGLPLFSTIPGVGLLTSQHTKQEENDELLILITPYVVRSPERSEAPEIWIGK
jgi:tetratricopeptide (TPR) repeat protein